MANPLTFFMLITTYLFIIRNGKKFMEHRKPFNIERLIIVYNIAQIIVNATIFVMVNFLKYANFHFIRKKNIFITCR